MTLFWHKLPTTVAWGFVEDGILITISESASLTACQMKITLVGSSSGWLKEIAGWNDSTDEIKEKIEVKDNGPSQEIIITKARGNIGVYTIYLSKAKFFGVTTPMYSFRSDQFCQRWGGKDIIFN